MKTPCPVCGTELAERGCWHMSVRCDGCGRIFDRYVYNALRRLARLEAAAKIEREFWKLPNAKVCIWQGYKNPHDAMCHDDKRSWYYRRRTRLAAMKALLAAVGEGNSK